MHKEDMAIKVCTGCGKELPATLDYFTKSKDGKHGLKPKCKKCRRNSTKQYRECNVNWKKEYDKKYKEKNKYRFKEYNKKYQKEYRLNMSEEQIEKIRECRKIYRRNNKDKINKYINKYRIQRKIKDIGFKILCNLRTRVSIAIKNNNKCDRTISLLGCTIDDVRIHLESKFQEGMTWDNYGIYGWHIDHIIPCAAFDLSDPEQQKICFNYKNLQPLWAKDNLKKGCRV